MKNFKLDFKNTIIILILIALILVILGVFLYRRANPVKEQTTVEKTFSDIKANIKTSQNGKSFDLAGNTILKQDDGTAIYYEYNHSPTQDELNQIAQIVGVDAGKITIIKQELQNVDGIQQYENQQIDNYYNNIQQMD